MPRQTEETNKDFENPAGTRSFKFLELFAGKAGFSKEVKWLCGKIVNIMEPLDVMGNWDILTEEGFEKAKKAVVDADHTHIAFPCRSFSRARRSDNYGSGQVVRTEDWPEGWGHPIAEDRNQILERALALIYLIEDAGKTWSLENPEHSFA